MLTDDDDDDPTVFGKHIIIIVLTTRIIPFHRISDRVLRRTFDFFPFFIIFFRFRRRRVHSVSSAGVYTRGSLVLALDPALLNNTLLNSFSRPDNNNNYCSTSSSCTYSRAIRHPLRRPCWCCPRSWRLWCARPRRNPRKTADWVSRV